MAKNFHEQFEGEVVEPPSERSTGFVFAGVSLIAAVLWRDDPAVLTGLIALAGGFVVSSLARPSLLRPLNLAWFRLSLVLNRIMSPVILFVLFAVAIVPFGLVMQMVRDPLRKKRPAEAASNWEVREAGAPARSSMRNQF